MSHVFVLSNDRRPLSKVASWHRNAVAHAGEGGRLAAVPVYTDPEARHLQRDPSSPCGSRSTRAARRRAWRWSTAPAGRWCGPPIRPTGGRRSGTRAQIAGRCVASGASARRATGRRALTTAAGERGAGYEVRQVLLEQWERRCAYCHQSNVPLPVEHLVPRDERWQPTRQQSDPGV
jgi:hypothetical protein